ncbi:flavodoxin [Parafrankia sp. FMc2]|uniref:flavodoxin n=1 Tax=Parafrankia sp. FMc2 TaxID=3233196 RepID=UPI0034D5CC6D
MSAHSTRRALLGAALAAATAGPALSGCSTSSDPEPGSRGDAAAQGGAPGTASLDPARAGQAGQAGRVLLAYFSRAGENYHYGGRRNLTVGNTEVLADLIAGRIDCDVHRIEAADPYPDDYEATVARNVREQNADARPAIAGSAPSLDRYDVVLLGSPIWNARPPMIMWTFTEALDFTGRTVHPVVTYAVSGLGRAADDYGRACRGATIGDGLAALGETVTDADQQVATWLTRTGLHRG